MIVSEGTVYGEKYYTVIPTFSKIKWDNMAVWCTESFGETPAEGVWTPQARWYENNQRFWFRDKKDLEWFLLKWE